MTKCVTGFSLLKSIVFSIIISLIIFVCSMTFLKTDDNNLKIFLGIVVFICMILFPGLAAAPGLKIVAIKNN